MDKLFIYSLILIIIFVISFIYNNKIYIIIFILHYKKQVPWYSDLPFNKNKIPSSFTDWMSNIKDETDIRELSIPGTHDSASSKFIGYCLCWINFISQVQSWSIEDQLICGIRYFDLRPGGDGIIYHGDHKTIYSFINIFEIFKNFLYNHPKECLFVRIQFQYKKCYNNIEITKQKIVYNIFDKYKDILYNDEIIPTIGKLRGKIYLLLERLNYNNYLIWDKNNIIKLQDYYRFWGIRNYEIEKKKNLVKEYLFNNEKDKLIINHCSAIGRGALTTLRYVAYCVNKVPFDEKGFRGIIALDFPGEDLIKHIIKQNKSFEYNDYSIISKDNLIY